jgi:hypothetical protein
LHTSASYFTLFSYKMLRFFVITPLRFHLQHFFCIEYASFCC